MENQNLKKKQDLLKEQAAANNGNVNEVPDLAEHLKGLDQAEKEDTTPPATKKTGLHGLPIWVNPDQID